MENFRLANIRITDDQIVDICKKTGCHLFIDSSRDKYNTIIDQNFSVGQLQRLAIARAFMQNTPIMLFDEPTSALDRENELEFINLLDEYAKDKTVVIVSHTLSLNNKYEKYKIAANDSKNV